MFSLIITVISIALVAALALATIYYGSSSMKDAKIAAAATRLSNEVLQVQGAVQLFKTNNLGVAPADISALTANGEYLKPGFNATWTSAEDFILTQNVASASVSDEVCLRFNQQRKIETVPACSDPAYADKVVCCSEA